MRRDKTAVFDTSDTTKITELENKGWEGVPDPTGVYRRYLLPPEAVSIRSRSSVENPRPRNPAAIKAALAARGIEYDPKPRETNSPDDEETSRDGSENNAPVHEKEPEEPRSEGSEGGRAA